MRVNSEIEKHIFESGLGPLTPGAVYERGWWRYKVISPTDVDIERIGEDMRILPSTMEPRKFIDEVDKKFWSALSPEPTDKKEEDESMSTKEEFATAIVWKTELDKGIIQKSSSRGYYHAGDVVICPLLNEFGIGDMVNVRVIFPEWKAPVAISAIKGKDVTSKDQLVQCRSSYLSHIWEVSVKEASVVGKEEGNPISTMGAYYINPEARLVFTSAKKLSDARPERAVKVMMVGPSGYGKTTLPKVFAERVSMNFMRMNCATIRDPEEWFGYREAVEGSTVFVRSEFARVIEEGNVVVVMDEFNRLEPWLHNTLFPLLDDDGCTTVHGEQFHIGPNVVVVGTINTGYKYTGTFELDEALYNRFDFVLEVGPMPTQEEAAVLMNRCGVEKGDAVDIVKMATKLRAMNVVCSTRTTLLIANMVSVGMSIREGFESAVVKRIPADGSGTNLRKQALDLVNVTLGVLSERKLTSDVFAGTAEDEVKGVSLTTLRLFRNHKDFQLALCIRTLRELPTPDKLSQKEAHKIAERLNMGEKLEIDVEDTGTPALSATLNTLINSGVDVIKAAK